ncbi:MAG: propionyl-CoA synthetase [Albidovulum sp.]|nr:propionyl-CoA synthetase [Albidovulum sp.]MDE0304546.1 propionyl-CoA synthetase [Albidovulum sp.]MDE0531454.1 propionyl-CoA synthetase [Albidovulum sp.]
MKYKEVYGQWQADPEAFWMRTAEAIDWIEPPTKALFADDPANCHWFADARVNGCWNAVDRHVEAGFGDQAAIVHASPITESEKTITFRELRDQVALFAGALSRRGLKKGDRAIIYMPMIPEALVAMLACARIGAIHSVVFGGFASHELAARINDASPKCIIAASCGIEPGRIVEYKPLADEAIDLAARKPDFCVVLQRQQAIAELVEGRDEDWEEFQKGAEPSSCVPVEGSHPAYILYTSGTTGQPKGVVRSTAGHLVALHWTMKNIYDVEPGEVFWAASDVGWVVGHSYICYAPLLHRNTTVVFEGKPVGTPDAAAFWRVIEKHGVRALFTAPTAFRAIKREDPAGSLIEDFDLSSLKTLFLAGERADPDTISWAESHLRVPVIDHWWQTETGWSIAANPVGIEKLPVKPGSPSLPMPGYDIRVLDDEGAECRRGELGAIVVRLPLPPGNFPTLWNSEDRFRKSYLERFPGYYETGDAGYVDEDGYLFVMSRTDDVINIAGHRLSTGAMEEVIANHQDVAECAVVGVEDDLKGQIPLAFICLNSGCEKEHSAISAECVRLVRQTIGPVAAFKLAAVVERLPKTRSGKILRGVMARIADGRSYKIPATIDDPAILSEIEVALNSLGYPKTN